MHESLTVSYAGAFQTDELQYWMASYRQVLTSEGLTLLRQRQLQRQPAGHRDPAAPGIQDPQRPVRRRRELSVHPQRERNLIGDRAVLRQRRPQRHPRRAQHARPAARRADQARCRLADPLRGHQPDQPGRQPGHRGPGRRRTRRPTLACQWPVRLHQVRGDLQPRCSRCPAIFRSWSPPMASGPGPPCSRPNLRLWRARVRARLSTPRSWSATTASSSWGNCATTSPIPAKCHAVSALWLRRPGWLHNLAPVARNTCECGWRFGWRGNSPRSAARPDGRFIGRQGCRRAYATTGDSSSSLPDVIEGRQRCPRASATC